MGAGLRVDSERLWATIVEQAALGATPAGGVRRLALTPEDGAVRRLFARWCEEAGLAVTIDAMGNLFARREGTDPHARAILFGSHLDTQMHGGKYDGVLGVLGGLEVLRTLDDAGVATRRPLVLVDWTNEEGARFEPPMIGSAVFAGLHDLAAAHALADKDGVTLGAALDALGMRGSARLTPAEVDAYFELHIEQGPELEERGLELGVVTGAYAVRGFLVECRGENAHAGPTRMPERRNALLGAAAVIEAVNEIGWAYASTGGRSTTTRIAAHPNLLGAIPSRAELVCDVRHPTPEGADAMLAAFEARLPLLAAKGACAVTIARRWTYGGRAFDAGCVEAVRQGAAALGLSRQDMLAVAGHDAMNLAYVVPSAMIFTPCAGGVSHNEAESMTQRQAADGANALLHAILARDAATQDAPG